jgi:hypothetical protein
VLDRVVPIKDLHRVGAELVGEVPVEHRAVARAASSDCVFHDSIASSTSLIVMSSRNVSSA